jgi:hypothetical protein
VPWLRRETVAVGFIPPTCVLSTELTSLGAAFGWMGTRRLVKGKAVTTSGNLLEIYQYQSITAIS